MIPHSRPTLENVSIERVSGLLESGRLARGMVCERLETEFTSRILQQPATSGYRARAVQSGTAALHVGLHALAAQRERVSRLPPRPEVITSSLACAALVHAIRMARAEPVLCDTDSQGNLDPEKGLELVTDNTIAFLVPHLYGRPVDLAPLLNTEIPVFEDCAQTLAVSGPQGAVGTSGRLMMTSFYATKLLCAGQGGLVASSDPELMDEVERYCSYDGTEDPRPAANYNLSDWSAQLALHQVEDFDSMLRKRRAIAERYTQALVPYQDRMTLPSIPTKGAHAWYRYVLQIPESSDEWMNKLSEKGIEAKRPVFRPLHLIFGLPGDFPTAEKHWRRSLSIAIYPTLSEEERERTLEAILETYESSG